MYAQFLRPQATVAFVLAIVLAVSGLGAPNPGKATPSKRARKVSSKRVAKPVVRRKATTRRKKAAVGSKQVNQPKKFVTVPVKTELRACSIPDRQATQAALCLNCAEQALSTAKAFIGLKYKRGGTNPNIGFDCSGFVRHVFVNSCGREIPRTAREQFELGEAVEQEDLQKGDLVFFSGRRGWHVGIYVGNRSFIHSPNRRSSIRISSLDADYWKKMYKGGKRITTDIAPVLMADTGEVPTN